MKETRLGLIKHWENRQPEEHKIEIVNGVECIDTIAGYIKKEDIHKIEYVYNETEEEIYELINGEITRKHDCEEIESSYGKLKPYTKYRLDKLRKNPYSYVLLHVEGDMDEYIENVTMHYIEERNNAYSDLKSKHPGLSHEELESLADEFVFNMDNI